MKTIRLSIPINAVDGYLYFGKLFLVLKDGTLVSYDWEKIVDRFVATRRESEVVIRLGFSRNDWYQNQQMKVVSKMPNWQKLFRNMWGSISKSDNILELNEIQQTKYLELNELPVFDVKAYGRRLFIASRAGIQEILLEINEYKNNVKIVYNERVFHHKVISLTAKYGELLLSADQQGLFSGTLWMTDNKPVDINKDKPIEGRSLRSEWANHNLVNYESPCHFSYLKNESEHVKERRGYKYSNIDESSEKIRITNFGVQKYTSASLFTEKKHRDNLLKYAFNSNNSLFMILSNNKFYVAQFLHSKDKDNIYLSQRVKELSSIRKTQQPLSSFLVPNGCIIEYFDSVDLYIGGDSIEITRNPIYTMKTFLQSKRHKNMFIYFDDHGVHIHSIFPYL